MLLHIKAFIKKEAVLCISALCAAATMLFVPPDGEYLHYIDFRVLAILFCLMAVVAGFKKSGVFSALTYQLLSRIKSGKILGATLVMLPFFSSMAITNDVALIVFVPFTIALLSEIGCRKSIVPVIVLQTVAANLGSMATPVGNPQNLFLYSTFSLGAGEFFRVTLPLTAVSLIVLLFSSLPLLPARPEIGELKKESVQDKKQLFVYAVLFILSLLTVLRIVPYELTTVITVAVFLVMCRELFGEIDFMLLLTFVCFFVISENLGRIDVIRSFLQALLEKNTLLTCVGASQVISNVPAAVLLSSFTDNWRDILEGVNIGGLGTPVASLASLITLKLYLKAPEAKIGRFMAVFTLANIIGLVILLGFTALI
ncbi:MAG: anion permease [Clostridia bacterium]|nr:anion permease [Clostridia bacterium]